MTTRRQLYALFRHAINAAQIATLRDGDTKVIMLAIIRVGEEIREWFGLPDPLTPRRRG